MRYLHASEITTYSVCPRMYRYTYVDRYAPKVTNHKLFLGSGVHAGLAAYYSDPWRSPQVGLDAYTKWVSKKMEEMLPDMTPEEQEQFDADARLGAKMLSAYFDWARAHDTFEVVTVEQEFETPVWKPNGKPARGIRHKGTFDGIARDVYGRLWLMEHKTYSQVPSESELRLDAQAGYYLVAAQQLFPNESVQGVIYTILRKVDPERAKSSIVHRSMVLRNQHEIDHLRERLYLMYRRITEDKHYLPTPGFHCGWRCAYRQLCIAEEDGSDVNELIAAFYTVQKENEEEKEVA